MKELLTKYSISDIVMFVILLVLAIKEFVSIVDWAKERMKKVFDKSYHEKEETEEMKKEIEDLEKFYGERKKVDDTFASINAQISMLIESDKEDIKAYITDRHHFFVYDQGWVDDYSMECIEKRFAIYEREHGNSFVRGLMDELRSLPKRPPVDIEHKYVGTAEYVRKSKG